MNSLSELLSDPAVELTIAWTAAQGLLGPTLPAWEFETIKLELERRHVPTTEGLMAKLLAAQSCAVTRAWTTDHDVFFAFALACDGIGANPGAIHHPTPEQLCWAVKELESLTEARITDDHGFDPDTVDPAVAVVLLDEGLCVAPEELTFARDVLEKITPGSKTLAPKAYAAFSRLRDYPDETLRRTLRDDPTSDVDVQVHRLIECQLYVEERVVRRARQHAVLNSFV